MPLDGHTGNKQGGTELQIKLKVYKVFEKYAAFMPFNAGAHSLKKESSLMEQ